MACALCKLERELQYSHIIPEFFYKPLYEKNPRRLHVLSTDSSVREKFEQKGLRECLLCRECEQRFCKWEDYTSGIIFGGQRKLVSNDGQILKLRHVDYEKFKLFLLSVLWRMSVSRLEFFAKVRLGRHEETLRLALLANDPLKPTDYPCLLTAVMIDGIFHQDWILPPDLVKYESHHCYRVVLSGFLFAFFVSSHPMPSSVFNYCINKRDEFRIFIQDIKQVPFLMDVAVRFGQAIRKRAGT